MPRFKKVFFVFWLTSVMLSFPGVLRNYSLTYLNWTYLPSPITSHAIFCFSNTNDCSQELTAAKRPVGCTESPP